MKRRTSTDAPRSVRLIPIRTVLVFLFLLTLKSTLKSGEKVDPAWLEDLPAGIARARAEGKPLFVVIRCET